MLALIKLHLCLKENYSEISACQVFSQSAQCPWTDILSDTQMKKTLVYQFTLQTFSLGNTFSISPLVYIWQKNALILVFIDIFASVKIINIMIKYV